MHDCDHSDDTGVGCEGKYFMVLNCDNCNDDQLCTTIGQLLAQLGNCD